jgi:putative hemolysin
MSATETPSPVREGREARKARLLAELDEIRPLLQQHQDEVTRLTQRRVEVQYELRGLRVPDREMAEHSGQNVGTVTQAIRAFRLKKSGKPISRRKSK